MVFVTAPHLGALTVKEVLVETSNIIFSIIRKIKTKRRV
jgi:hypothetical protein